MRKEIILMESAGTLSKGVCCNIYAEVEASITDDSFDHEFGTEHVQGLEIDILRFYQVIEKDGNVVFSSNIDDDCISDEVLQFYIDFVDEEVRGMDDEDLQC